MRDSFVQQFVRTLAAIPYKGFRMVDYRTLPSYRQGIRNLTYRGILKHQDETYRFTLSGKRWLDAQRIKYCRYADVKWDEKWRVVIFDIPSHMNRERHIFRNRIKALGFYMIQRSVFVLPYPCEQPLSEICRRLKLTGYVDIILAESILSHEENLRKIFSL